VSIYRRCRSLDEALSKIEAGTLPRGSRIVVSWDWWDALSEVERDAFRARSDLRGVSLSADHRISRHFVEVSDGVTPPLTSERRV
jgi:hypothetical protein